MKGCVSCNKRVAEHFKPRRRDRVSTGFPLKPTEPCYICQRTTWDVEYCNFCGHWLCEACRKNPAKRFNAMLKEFLKK